MNIYGFNARSPEGHDKALEDLKYEGEDCEQIKVKSQNLSNLIQNVIEKIEHQKS